jgi:hypothetical protein
LNQRNGFIAHLPSRISGQGAETVQRFRIRLMTVLSIRFKAACSALVAGPRGLGLGLAAGLDGVFNTGC